MAEKEKDDEFEFAPPIEGAKRLQIDMRESTDKFAGPLDQDLLKQSSNIEKAKSFIAGLGTGAVGAHVGAALGAKDVVGSLGRGLKGTIVNYFGTDTGIPSDAQNARIRAGNVDAQGTTGRARMGFNEVTAAQAAQRKEVERVMQELARRGIIVDENVLARMPGVTSSPQGVLVPSSAVYEAGETVAPKAGTRIGQFITSHPFVSKTLTGGLGGFGVGYGVSEAARKAAEGNYFGAGLSGLEALASGASMVPAFAPVAIPVSIGLGGLSELVEMSRNRPADTKPLTPEEQKKAQQAAYGISPAYMAMMARRRAPTMLAQE